ncbi:LacI family DNA-binding transcriptional regulator [candidate division KSB1 bacterium]|nr:LacI family DNA-binding transcriptional regulator [candidate division KSB1 bacterium]
MKKTTIEDVARKAGVSKGTVSAVINNKPTVKSSTREHVLKTIKELNFRPKGFARVLKGQNVEKSIGLIARAFDNPFYTSIAIGIKRYANAKGYALFVASSEGNHANEETISRLFSNKDVKGAIIAPVLDGTIEIAHLFNLRAINYPFVLLEEVPGIQTNVVSIDNTNSTYKATKYLIDSGHEKIIHFSGPEYSSHTFERINGFRNAFSESNLIFNKELIIPAGSHFQDGYKTGKQYFSSIAPENRPSAVVCFNDVIAFGLIAALKELSIQVPEDISIIGHDDIEFARYWSPPLTTISTPVDELGRIAADILIRSIESPHALPAEKKILQADLVIRESSKRLK